MNDELFEIEYILNKKNGEKIKGKCKVNIEMYAKIRCKSIERIKYEYDN